LPLPEIEPPLLGHVLLGMETCMGAT
jgi:hypothetical protein